MTTVPKPSSLAYGLTCKYDAWNRLVEVKDGATTLAKHRYDGLRRRIDRTTFVPVAFRHNHTYYNASWQILEIRQVVGETGQPEAFQPTYQYVWSARYIDAPVLQDLNSDQDGLCDDFRFYYLSDANFNVTTLLDTSGDALEHYGYDPYGKVTVYAWDSWEVEYGFAYGFRFGYTGREYNPYTGLYHYRNRHYHPGLGRFLSRDPIGYGGGDRNLYRYVSNRPTTYSDAFGLRPSEPLDDGGWRPSPPHDWGRPYGPDGRPIFRWEPKPSCPPGCREIDSGYVQYRRERELEDEKIVRRVNCWVESPHGSTPFSVRLEEWTYVITEYYKQYLGVVQWQVTCMRNVVYYDPCGNQRIRCVPCATVYSRVFGPVVYAERKYYKRHVIRSAERKVIVNPSPGYFRRVPSCTDLLRN